MQTEVTLQAILPEDTANAEMDSVGHSAPRSVLPYGWEPKSQGALLCPRTCPDSQFYHCLDQQSELTKMAALRP